MRRRRSELLPPDRGLQARMLLVMLLTPALVLGGVAGVIAFAPLRVVAGVLIVAAVGVVVGARDEERRPARGIAVPAEQRPEIHAIVDRLCLLADLRRPEIVVEYEDQPNSWVEAPARGSARLHLTTGLLALLSPAELEAVIGHELAHLVHHDARVMSVVGGSGTLLLEGARRATRNDWWFAIVGGIVAAAAIGWVSRLGTLTLARHRELIADAGSAALTRRPAALASALRRISGELALVPATDLRVAAPRDLFHLVPVDDERCRGAVLRTHPPLARRIERLERLERTLHAARAAQAVRDDPADDRHARP
jgi:heat shock protein HtpX